MAPTPLDQAVSAPPTTEDPAVRADSFEAVMSRVGTLLETASRYGGETGGSSGAATTTAAGGGAQPGGPADTTVAALRRVGLEQSVVTAVAEGLDRGGDLESLLLEALLLEAFGGLTPAPPLPRRAGSLLVVVGAGVPARRLAAALADEIGVDPVEVPFASRDASAYTVVTGKLLVRSAEDAAELAPGWRRSKPAVVAVDAAVTGTERSWASHVIASLRPTAVWGVVDATSKTEDVAAWVQALGGIDALAVENLDATVSPAAALGLGIAVARIDGQPATAARWVATIVDRVDPWV